MSLTKMSFIILTIISLGSCVGGEQREKGQQKKGQGSDSANIISTILELPVYDITDKQREDLKYMWEEEKLARDVYITLSYQGRVFQNISKSEQSHMDAVAALIKKYGIASVGINNVGIFSTDTFQSLYNELVARGHSSAREATYVGIEIEDLDIFDLQNKMNGAPEDFRLVFQKLLDASYKHKSAFERQI